ncbi:MAG: signal peptidase I [Armatimonadetes bacterium]|nr:signal peptidase I [Armatimonadota bacterium]MDE2205559.1 signal peptidase I [Armatimonadota bacterium]
MAEIVRLGAEEAAVEDEEKREAARAEAAERKARRQRGQQRRLMFLLPLVTVLAIIAWCFSTQFIPSQSMEPYLQPGDHIVTLKSWLAYPDHAVPSRGDVVVFNLPAKQQLQDPNAWVSGSPPQAAILIKRVVGLPGETIEFQGNEVLINGKALVENYRTIPETRRVGGAYGTDGPFRIPAHHIFLMGDNRPDSDDSRFWGPLNVKNVMGRCMGVLFHESANGFNERRYQKTTGQ